MADRCRRRIVGRDSPDDGTHFYNIERPKYYQTIHGRRPIGRLHCVTVTGLEPGTKYRYRIFQRAVLSNQGRVRVLYSAPYGSDILSHKPYCVRTLDAAAQTTRFAVGNDFHEAPICCASSSTAKRSTPTTMISSSTTATW